MDVPKPNTIGDVTVLLVESGKPSKVLQKTEVEPSTPEPVEVAKVEPPKEETVKEEPVAEVEESDEDVPETEVKQPEEEIANSTVSDTAQETVSIAKPEETSKVEAKEEVQEPTVAKPVIEAKLAPVLIEAADIEATKIFIAGTGEPRSTINIYLENKFLGTVKVADNGAFLFEGTKDIGPGRYDIRADMTKGGVEVLARAEVRLVHEPKVVELAKEEPVKAESVPEATETVEAESAQTEVEPAETEAADLQTEPEAETEAEVEVEAETEVVVNTEEAKEVEPVVVDEAKTEENTETTVEEVVASVAKEDEPEAAAEVAETEEPKPVEVEAPKKEIQTGSAVIIRRGDNLWTVARRNYGAGIRYTTIFDANRDQVRDPDLIYPGQVLKVPENEQSVE